MSRCSKVVQTPSLFDHLVGGGEQRRRHREAEHSGSRGVDDEFEPARLHHRQVRRLDALEDAAGIGAELAIRIRNVAELISPPASVTSRAYDARGTA